MPDSQEKEKKAQIILEENEKMKTLKRAVLDLKDLSARCNDAVTEDISYIDQVIQKSTKDRLTIQNIMQKLDAVKKDSFMLILIVTVVGLGALLFIGLLFK
ncbi:hypothetical protein NEPAR06_0361 [Nematocida parisii]|nr:uncharacterized protein NEPG_01274 [Nematocida parisii ERTm1]KAI5125363.1 hypothetical protein NEPAR03_0038 [Nematocida parisii]EIJ93702.1 hypothetical protein NEPG_01274 [Nematocida parisii ERTm1]KAI5125487.1 hypothetical protein NEPAR08_0038 [Nematocida parisii]KAI5140631.1 hypothetical protein NEPAR04_0372 [Nematocida parisii]KAI5142348.1 hypothetical protein NEPAR07_0090 [Nematocida parisii]|eukprot:XP_013059102.1 hypothetical protein NEPG_01274 [Nematocida parisii ERTm1]